MRAFQALLLSALLWGGESGAQTLGMRRWNDRVGVSAIDSLTWSQQGSFSKKDTLELARNDTTLNTIEITGVWQCSLFWEFTANMSLGGEHPHIRPHGRLIVEVSPDGNKKGAMWYKVRDAPLEYGIGSMILAQARIDENEQLFRAGSFMRVIADCPDPGILCLILTRVWPPPLTKNGEQFDDLLWFLIGRLHP